MQAASVLQDGSPNQKSFDLDPNEAGGGVEHRPGRSMTAGICWDSLKACSEKSATVATKTNLERTIVLDSTRHSLECDDRLKAP